MVGIIYRAGIAIIVVLASGVGIAVAITIINRVGVAIELAIGIDGYRNIANAVALRIPTCVRIDIVHLILYITLATSDHIIIGRLI